MNAIVTGRRLFNGLSGAKQAAVLAVMLVLAGEAGATDTLPAGVATAVTAVQTNGQAIFDLVFPVIAVLVGLVVVIKLFKRFVAKV